jgi:CDGSH-type Zn-finger protein
MVCSHGRHADRERERSVRTVGPLTIVDPTGELVEVPKGRRVWLCRCGGSSDKPFCEGTHEKNGFQADNLGPPGLQENDNLTSRSRASARAGEGLARMDL